MGRGSFLVKFPMTSVFHVEPALPVRVVVGSGLRAPSGRPPASPAFKVAEELLARKGRSFHWARRFLSPSHADRTTRLYGFCRRVDDLADESQAPEVARAELDLLDRDLRAGVSADPLTVDAIRLFNECDISTEIPSLLIAGVAGDLDPVRITTDDALLRYCYSVAGTVGLMMCATLDATDPRALPHAIDLGIAMQLTNLCRDVFEDALAGRRYLPASLIGDIEPERLIAPDEDDFERAQSAVLTLLDRADVYYASGEDGLRYLPARARYAILAAARIYRSIGLRVRRRTFEAWQRRAVVPSAMKAAISVTALLSLRTQSRDRPHAATLHTALAGLPGIDQHADVRHG